MIIDGYLLFWASMWVYSFVLYVGIRLMQIEFRKYYTTLWGHHHLGALFMEFTTNSNEKFETCFGTKSMNEYNISNISNIFIQVSSVVFSRKLKYKNNFIFCIWCIMCILLLGLIILYIKYLYITTPEMIAL